MSIIFKEITDVRDLPKVYKLQKDIFGFSDAEAIPVGLLNLLIREQYKLGCVITCYLKEKIEPVGLVILMNGTQLDTYYTTLIGVLPKYTRSKISFQFIYELGKWVLNNNKKQLIGVFNPMDANLAKIYSYNRMNVYQYLIEDESDILSDKLLFNWRMKDKENYDRLLGKRKYTPKEAISKLPVLNSVHENYKEFLLEIPNDFRNLLSVNKTKATEWAEYVRTVFIDFLNNKGYTILDCFSVVHSKEKKTFYLFSKIDDEKC